MPSGGPTVKSLDDRLDDLERSFADFKGRVETVVQLAKWIAGFAATTLITSIVLALSAVWSAGNMSAKLDAQADRIKDLAAVVEKQSASIDRLSQELAAVRTTLTRIEGGMGKAKRGD